MTVELPAGVEVVETDCGSRQEPFAAEQRSVKARELRKAEELLARLQEAGSTGAGGACANPSSLTCAEIENLMMVGVPKDIIIQAIRDAGGCFSPKTLSCLKKKGIPPAIIEAARSVK